MIHNKCNVPVTDLPEADRVRDDPDDADILKQPGEEENPGQLEDDVDDVPQSSWQSQHRQTKRPGCWTSKNECRWKFPKTRNQISFFYKRPHGTELYHRGQDLVVDNSWIIPYNPTLLVRYNCHINLELFVGNPIQICRHSNAYINKGLDSINLRCVEFGFDETTNTVIWDEPAAYVKMRNIGPHGAIYRILGLSCFQISHSVVTLPVDLENEQFEIFYEV
ncbi:unnamed protein product [Ceutorhynchus assimilis]|uniref:Uncharacterized protein n=1 Tax=Ceutorhynchus assimilis TaxID=467358 RepID=A0A9N9MNA0_9CUCU|nr:unnamed protein product [Ceutorhynchus assimilis]